MSLQCNELASGCNGLYPSFGDTLHYRSDRRHGQLGGVQELALERDCVRFLFVLFALIHPHSVRLRRQITAIHAVHPFPQLGLIGNVRCFGVAGGSTMFTGFQERLWQELEALRLDSSLKVSVVAPPERKYSAWIGGSILTIHRQHSFKSEGANGTSNRLWVTQEDYERDGAAAVHTKCF